MSRVDHGGIHDVTAGRSPVSRSTTMAPGGRCLTVIGTPIGCLVRSHAGTHVVVDVAGWFVGTPIEATAPRGRNPLPAENERVLFVSDSSLAGIRWGGALGCGLQSVDRARDRLVGGNAHANDERVGAGRSIRHRGDRHRLQRLVRRPDRLARCSRRRKGIQRSSDDLSNVGYGSAAPRSTHPEQPDLRGRIRRPNYPGGWRTTPDETDWVTRRRSPHARPRLTLALTRPPARIGARPGGCAPTRSTGPS